MRAGRCAYVYAYCMDGEAGRLGCLSWDRIAGRAVEKKENRNEQERKQATSSHFMVICWRKP